MKKIFTIAAAFLMTASVWAQAPEKMSYQAVVRDASNALVTTQAVGMQISILQGGATGTPVYIETQTPTANANGLVSIEIGAGTVVSGDFTTIDWANDTYFIKTETDPTGGTNYIITGTTQLMSVPYALHAKTAESITGTVNYTETDPIFSSSIASGITGTDTTNWNNKLDSYTETDPIFGSSIASGITGIDTTNWNNKLDSYTETDPIFGASVASGITGTDTTNWNNKLDSYTETDPIFGASVASGITAADTVNWNNKLDGVDGSETKVTAGTNITVTGSGTTVNPYVVGTTGTLAIGDSYQGGIIFWLDASGQHGLIAATSDQSTSIQWYNGTNTVTNTVRDGVYAGKYNTERIIANQGPGAYAAQVCANYQGGNYGDWYLPSKYELNLLYAQKTAVGGFASAYYWSSYEGGNNNAWVQSFDNGYQYGYYKNDPNRVRAVRAF